MTSSKTSQLAISMVNNTTKVNVWNRKKLAIHAFVEEILKINQHMKTNIARKLTAILTYITAIEFMMDVLQFITKLRTGKAWSFQYQNFSKKFLNFSIIVVQSELVVQTMTQQSLKPKTQIQQKIYHSVYLETWSCQ